ncbi:MAG TPA: hypothetical protein VMI30_13950 [Stellaceae bacterium]|nr:hypothetical protein [Stellaceae bacterium]
MADTVQINVGANADEAIDALDRLRAKTAELGSSFAAMQGASAQASQAQQEFIQELLQGTLTATRAMQRANADYVAAFKNGMQVLVDSKQLTLQQALGFDIDYSAQVFQHEQERLQAVIDNDAATLADRETAIAMMQQAEPRYVAQTSNEYRQMADAARRESDRVAQSYERAFDRVGSSVQRSFNEILTGQTSWAKGMTRVIQDVETFFLDEVETMAAKWAASGLASLAGGAVSGAVSAAQSTGASGLGAGVTALLGFGQPGGLFGSGLFAGSGAVNATAQAASIVANTTALGASTSAMAALTAALTGATAASGTSAGASLAGGAAAAGTAASGGGFFSWLGGLFAFGDGGIVPSAAGGWALPNFAGATPALLHAREMVLPADISQGLQGMIAGGGAGDAHFHAHFHGPADAPAVSRWFRDNLRSNAGALRDLFRQNALTPRSF